MFCGVSSVSFCVMASCWTDEDHELLQGQERWSAVQKQHQLSTGEEASAANEDCIFLEEEIILQRKLLSEASDTSSEDPDDHSSVDLALFSENSDEPPAIFTVSHQRRPRTRHGWGGRPRLGAPQDRAKRLVFAICNAIKRYVEALCAQQLVEDVLADILRRRRRTQEILWDGRRLSFPERLVFSSNIRMLRGCPVMVCCTKESSHNYGESRVAMDKHAVCTWLDPEGALHCTCTGITAFRVLLSGINECAGTCIHIRGVRSYVNIISKAFAISDLLAQKLLAELFATISPTSFAQYRQNCPAQEILFLGKVSVYSEIVPSASGENIIIVPVRSLRNSTKVCAFCDSLPGTSCRHVRAINGLPHDAPDNTVAAPLQIEKEEENHARSSRFSHTSINGHISKLSVLPVNCPKALRVDRDVCKMAVDGKPYTIEAPMNCQMCGRPRLESSITIWENGILFCTIGLCRMHIEEFTCSNTHCGAKITAEGKQQCIVLDKVTVGGTHVFLRRELVGVVIGNGTLAGRVKQYHGVASANVMSAAIPPGSVEMKSEKVIIRLCKTMLKLMCLDPHPSLFVCKQCENDSDGNRRDLIPAVCIDAIYQGYMHKKQVLLENISQSCDPISVSHAANMTGARRPSPHLIRNSSTSRIFLKIVCGESVFCDITNIKDFAGCLRMVSDEILPTHFCPSSVCGRASHDLSEDLGLTSSLQSIREFVKTFFDKAVLKNRLWAPLMKFIQQLHDQGNADTLESLGALGRDAVIRYRNGRQRISRSLPSVLEALECLDIAEQDKIIGVCWCSELFKQNRRCSVITDRRSEMLNIVKMIFRGPLTQFITRESHGSLHYVGELCLQPKCAPLMAHIRRPLLHSSSAQTDRQETGSEPFMAHPTNSHLAPRVTDENKSSDTSEGPVVAQSAVSFSAINVSERLTNRCRYLKSALLTIANIERHVEINKGSSMRLAFSNILLSCHRVITNFYRVYEQYMQTNNPCSAISYAIEWNDGSEEILVRKMRQKYNPPKESAFENACRTGSYFPGRRQVRPFPFNPDQPKFVHNKDHGPCSKDFLQRQSSYTPGVMTASCFCTHPVAFGRKVLYRNEGTKIVLDMLLSRFAKLSRHIIYDFACGLHSSAIHTLWWATQDCLLVTDNFHFKNHTSCSSSYSPKAHTSLDGVNTVSHEQRNQEIKLLRRSLRNSSHDFTFHFSPITRSFTISVLCPKTRRFFKEDEGRSQILTCSGVISTVCSGAVTFVQVDQEKLYNLCNETFYVPIAFFAVKVSYSSTVFKYKSLQPFNSHWATKYLAHKKNQVLQF